MKISDFPKLESPFEREETDKGYICIPKFKRDFSWILNKDVVQAQEKFDGTCCSILIEEGNIKAVFNRTNRIDIWKSGRWFYEGVKQAIDEGKLKPDMLDGHYFGELIGKKINGNPYNIEGHLFIPFDYCKNHFYFKFYYGWLEENNLTEKTDKELYDAFRELFQNLKSLWFRKRGIEKQPEGIVFYNLKTGEMCKLRCDMWDFWKEERHKKKLK